MHLEAAGETVVSIDLLPDVSIDDLTVRLSAPRGKQSLANFLRKVANLSPAAIGLLHETAPTPAGKMKPADLASLIKNIPVRLTDTAPIARAISTAGGISFDEIDEHFMLRKMPGVFVAGEMLDWEAPTGGYLLQASFATGAAAGRGALAWLVPQQNRRQRKTTAKSERAVGQRIKTGLLPFQFLAQDFQLQPFSFCGCDFILRGRRSF